LPFHLRLGSDRAEDRRADFAVESAERRRALSIRWTPFPE
jgi:hypothetical protein